jgi:hypothetical protein
MRHLLTILFFCAIVLAGCSKRPANMPATIPCTITIVNGGTPQAGYDVGLHSVTGNGSLSIMAYTNSSGVAEIRTRLANYAASGAPAGTYKVTVEKQVQLPPDDIKALSQMSDDERNAYSIKRAAEAEKLRVVPVKLTQSKTTPFEIKLEPGGSNQWTFDLKEHL